MKNSFKIFITSLTAVLLIFNFSACKTQDNNDTSKIPVTTIVEPVNQHISSYDKYSEFINTTELPDYFVSYDDISHFGEFFQFYSSSPTTPDDYHVLSYTLAVEDIKFAIGIHYIDFERLDSTEGRTVLESRHINPSDMRLLNFPRDDKGIYIHNGIQYWYDPSGELSHIIWDKGTLEYSVKDIPCDRPIPNAASTLSKLLNLDTAESVVNSLKGYEEKGS